jgi:hypothetical protein
VYGKLGDTPRTVAEFLKQNVKMKFESPKIHSANSSNCKHGIPRSCTNGSNKIKENRLIAQSKDVHTTINR